MDTNADIARAIRDYRPTLLTEAQWSRVAEDLRRLVRGARPTSVEDARKLCQVGARLVRELDGHVDWSSLKDLLTEARRSMFLNRVTAAGAKRKTVENLRRRLDRLVGGGAVAVNPAPRDDRHELADVDRASLRAALSVADEPVAELLTDVLRVLDDGPGPIVSDRRRATVDGETITVAWARRRWLVDNDGEVALLGLVRRGIRAADLNAAARHLGAAG